MHRYPANKQSLSWESVAVRAKKEAAAKGTINWRTVQADYYPHGVPTSYCADHYKLNSYSDFNSKSCNVCLTCCQSPGIPWAGYPHRTNECQNHCSAYNTAGWKWGCTSETLCKNDSGDNCRFHHCKKTGRYGECLEKGTCVWWNVSKAKCTKVGTEHCLLTETSAGNIYQGYTGGPVCST